MTKRQKALLLLFTPFFIGFLLGFCLRGCFSDNSVPKTEIVSEELTPVEEIIDEVIESEPIDEPKQVIYYRNRLPYSTLFADQNDEHISVAKEQGLSTIPKVRKQVDTRSLQLIEDNDNLVIDNLRYSIPYLTKKSAKELYRIADNFADSLISKGFPKYRLIVSSVLRTEEDVNRLRRSGNPNASSNSAHCYGTTFDITYTRYEAEDESEFIMQPFELTKVLGEVLLDEKKAGRILVKYERKEHCFHITSK